MGEDWGEWDAGMVYKLIINRGYSISPYLGRPKIEKSSGPRSVSEDPKN